MEKKKVFSRSIMKGGTIPTSSESLKEQITKIAKSSTDPNSLINFYLLQQQPEHGKSINEITEAMKDAALDIRDSLFTRNIFIAIGVCDPEYVNNPDIGFFLSLRVTINNVDHLKDVVKFLINHYVETCRMDLIRLIARDVPFCKGDIDYAVARKLSSM